MDSNLGRIQSVPTLIAIVIELQNMVSVLLESESNDTSIPISKSGSWFWTVSNTLFWKTNKCYHNFQ
mgnify:FL=1